jgi:hypothetical protein
LDLESTFKDVEHASPCTISPISDFETAPAFDYNHDNVIPKRGSRVGAVDVFEAPTGAAAATKFSSKIDFDTISQTDVGKFDESMSMMERHCPLYEPSWSFAVEFFPPQKRDVYHQPL